MLELYRIYCQSYQHFLFISKLPQEDRNGLVGLVDLGGVPKVKLFAAESTLSVGGEKAERSWRFWRSQTRRFGFAAVLPVTRVDQRHRLGADEISVGINK